MTYRDPNAPTPLNYAPPRGGNTLTLPAIGIMVGTVFIGLFVNWLLLMALMGLLMVASDGTPWSGSQLIAALLIFGVVCLGIEGVFVLAFISGITMLNRRYYRFTFFGAILSTLASPPFGIWALVLLSRPDVRASFHDMRN